MGEPILIVGAGMSGLLAGRRLQDAGQEVLVLDKGRGVGGRMATRRIQGVPFDHGAQFFTAHDPRFRQWVEKWQADGLVSIWSSGFPDQNGQMAPDRHVRYMANQGMTAIPKALAEGLNVHLEARVSAVRQDGGLWRVELDSGESIRGRALLLTPPVPQSLALLDEGSFELPRAARQSLEGIRYDPCISLMALFNGPSHIPAPGAIYFSEGPLAWMTDNHQKGISPQDFGITIHAGPQFSRAHWQTKDEEVAQQMVSAAAKWLDGDIITWQLHRWRYSRPQNPYPQPMLSVAGSSLIFAGDAFNGPRVEGAFLSGWAAAEALLDAI